MLEQVYPEGLQPARRTDDASGEKYEKEQLSEKNWYVLATTTHYLHPLPCSAQGLGRRGGRGIGNEGLKLRLRKKRSVRKVFPFFVFVSYNPELFLLVNK